MDANLKEQLRQWALAEGFDAFGVTVPAASDAAGLRLAQFLAKERHGGMDWMARNAERRASVSRLWPQARSVIMLGMSYAPNADPLAALQNRDHGVISVYAQGRDYHDVLKKRLKRLAARFQAACGSEVKVFVDTAPLMEKPLAEAAGLGWQGKHTNLVSRREGSWLFLGAILTTAELTPDEPAADHCGSCRACLDICPTAAFPAPYQLDARRCLAYLSIEHKGHIAREFRVAMGNRVFGCDDCLAVCPWNKFALQAREAKFAARDATANPPLAELLALNDAAFRLRFAGTPVKRTGRDRIVRNCLIAAGNAKEPALIPAIVALLGDPSPLVRLAAVWALGRVVGPGDFEAMRDGYLADETDAEVRSEWLATHPAERHNVAP